jgi:hypothetical protein
MAFHREGLSHWPIWRTSSIYQMPHCVLGNCNYLRNLKKMPAH